MSMFKESNRKCPILGVALVSAQGQPKAGRGTKGRMVVLDGNINISQEFARFL